MARRGGAARWRGGGGAVPGLWRGAVAGRCLACDWTAAARWRGGYIYIYMFMCFCPRGVFLTLGAAAPGNLRREWPWVCFCPIGVFLPLGAAAPGDLRPEWPWVCF